MTHPHADKHHVMKRYSQHILGCKRKWGSARGLIHYRAIISTYLASKRVVFLETKQKAPGHNT